MKVVVRDSARWVEAIPACPWCGKEGWHLCPERKDDSLETIVYDSTLYDDGLRKSTGEDQG